MNKVRFTMQPVKLSFITVCLFLLFYCRTGSAQLFPEHRVTTWKPGIPETVPTINGPVIDAVTDFGAVNDSSQDASGALQSALSSLKETGGIVVLPPGIYRVDSQLVFDGDRTVLRGAGADRTRLFLGYPGHSMFIGMYGRGEWQEVISAEKGSTTITVSDGSLFTPGKFAELQQANDSARMYTDTAWIVDWAENMVGQLFEVSSVNCNEVTFTSPLHFELRMELNPQIRPQAFRTSVGIEDLYLEKTVSEGHTIHIKNAAYCWVKRIESNVTRKAHIETATALGCTFSENYLHHSYSYGGGGSGYGTSLHTHTTDCLVENNIFNHLRHAMIIQNGATGNVFAWNFSTDPVQGASDSVTLNDTWDPPDISFHGHYAQYNLAEGNIVTEIGISDHWGPMGPGNTFFRNEVFGVDGIVLKDHSHFQNLAGNAAPAFNDDGTSSDILLYGNRFGERPAQWDSTIADTTLPPSLIYTTVPAFWPAAMQWPGVGSDVEKPGSNPAAARWKSGVYFPENTSLINKPENITKKESNPVIVRYDNYFLYVHSNLTAHVEFIRIDGRLLRSHVLNHYESSVPLPCSQGTYIAVVSSPGYKNHIRILSFK